MIKSLADTHGKVCMLGLTYFDLQGDTIKQSLLGGRVVSADDEAGITLELLSQSGNAKKAEFIIPSNLSCWFKAPVGEFHTSQESFKITNPDFLVTWDVYQTQKNTTDGEQQWWEWVPREILPNVNA